MSELGIYLNAGVAALNAGLFLSTSGSAVHASLFVFCTLTTIIMVVQNE